VRTRLRLVIALLALLGGCALANRPPQSMLERADRLVEQGHYAAAVRIYDELLATYPTASVAPRAVASRETLSTLLAARADVVRLKEELAARDTELGRLKQELQRLVTQTEGLRADLEELKKIDLKPERRRR